MTAWLERRHESASQRRSLARSPSKSAASSEVGDGIALVSGLPDARLDELLRFERGQFGFATTLDRDLIGCVLLDELDAIEAGDIVRGTGEVVRVPVGPGLLGRIVDPLGRPLDGGEPIDAESYEPVERPAPAIIDRDLVTEPVQTGLLVDRFAVCARARAARADHRRPRDRQDRDRRRHHHQPEIQRHHLRLCRGRAEVLDRRAGDRRDAPTARRSAASSSSPARRLRRVCNGSRRSPASRWRNISAIAGSMRWSCIDDLTKHAATHREIALLTRHPPGREAYPGDVFYVHARLLERAAKLSQAAGGGSLTALPIAETDAGNLSAYIPTNLISITDGQIVLDCAAVPCGPKPAVDVGTSVSRVGGKTQAPACAKRRRRCGWITRSSWNLRCSPASAA